jgi:hypothetical protein
MARTGETTQDYLQHHRASNETEIEHLNADFEDRSRYDNNANPIATTWLISFQHLAETYPIAIKYLKFICFLAEKDIPVLLLPPERDERARRKAISILAGYAFIMVRGQSDSSDMHRLVRLATKNWLGRDWRACCTNICSTCPKPIHIQYMRTDRYG